MADDALGTVTVDLEGTVVSDAIPTFVKVSSPGALTGVPGGDEVLDLGQVPVDSYDQTVSIAIANEAVGDADSLAGLLTSAGSGVTLPLAWFSGVAPSGASGDYDFTIALTLIGELWDVVTLMPVDSVVGDLPFQTLIIEADVVACFLCATRIATPCGEVCLEDLRLGDLVDWRPSAAAPTPKSGRLLCRVVTAPLIGKR